LPVRLELRRLVSRVCRLENITITKSHRCRLLEKGVAVDLQALRGGREEAGAERVFKHLPVVVQCSANISVTRPTLVTRMPRRQGHDYSVKFSTINIINTKILPNNPVTYLREQKKSKTLF
jgi:hypothetical protein